METYICLQSHIRNLSTDLNKIRYLSLIKKNGVNKIFTSIGLVVLLLYNYVCLEFWSKRNVIWGYNYLVARKSSKRVAICWFPRQVHHLHYLQYGGFHLLHTEPCGLGRTLMLVPCCPLRTAHGICVQWYVIHWNTGSLADLSIFSGAHPYACAAPAEFLPTCTE